MKVPVWIFSAQYKPEMKLQKLGRNFTSCGRGYIRSKFENKHLEKLELKWKSDHIPNDRVCQSVAMVVHHSQVGYSIILYQIWYSYSIAYVCPPLEFCHLWRPLKLDSFGIVSIGAEFYGNNSSSFMSLETLIFYKMKEWECKTTSFPRLQHLSMVECPKLKGLSN